MSRYIDAEKLKEKLDNFISMSQTYTEYDCGYDDCFTAIQDTLADIPTADVAEVKHAHWTDAVSGCWHCSECLHPILLNGGEEYVFSNHCPNCGARMDGERKDEE